MIPNRSKKSVAIHQKHIEEIQEFTTNGLVPPMNLNFNFSPSTRQLELWQSLQANSCDKCGGEIIRKKTDLSVSVTGTIPVCKKCGNENIPQIVLGGGAAGGGKAGLLSSSVLTPYGFKKLGDIKLGDELISPTTGEKQKVLHLHPIDTFNFYRIHFEDGTSFDCSEGHLWVSWRTRGSSDLKKSDNGDWVHEQLWETKTMYEFLENKKLSSSTINLKIPVTKPVNFYHYGNKDKRPIDSYLMGAFIGDGSATESCNKAPTFANGDAEMLGFFLDDKSIDENKVTIVKDIKDSKEGFFKLRFKDRSFYDSLVKLKLYGKGSLDKFIPDAYKYAPLEERYKLIQGMIDTDAEVDSRGHITYTTISKQLADDFAFVTRSLGCVSTITKRSTTGYKDKDGNFVHCNDAYNIQVRSWDNKKLMRLTRKIKNCKDGFNGGKSPLGKQITSIEYIGKKEGRCITVDKSHGLYIVDDFTVTHNSYVGCKWVLMSCMMFAKIKAVIARKTLKSLSESTWATLKFIMTEELNLIEKLHYKEDKVKGEILLWNGSTIVKKELELLPSDPTYQRLGSSEFTIAFIDEVGEISEKGVEVLYSRLRWRVAQTFKVPKLFLSTNPVPNWVRDRFVQNKDGEPIKCKRGDKFVQFSVFDNPDKEFVEGYASNLGNMRDKKEVQRLLYGNWDFIDSSDTVCYSKLNGDIHIVTNLEEKVYNPLSPLVISMDFNVIPQMSALVIQVDYEKKELYFLREMSGTPKEKKNSTPAMSRYISEFINKIGHKAGGVVVTGDVTGGQRSAVSEVDVNNYSVVISEMKKKKIIATTNVMKKNPPQSTRLDFINDILDGKTEWKIMIDLRCRQLTSDMLYQERNPDGTKSKKKITDPETGSKYEKYGHFSDCLDYAICTLLKDEWNKFIDGDLAGAYSPDAIISTTSRPIFGF